MNDLISRKDAISAFTVVDMGGTFCYCDSIVETLKNLPSAQPKERIVASVHVDMEKLKRVVDENVMEIKRALTERKKGRWYLEHHVWFCDQCGKNPTKGMGYVQGTDELFSFCPNCGADMRGDQNED